MWPEPSEQQNHDPAAVLVSFWQSATPEARELLKPIQNESQYAQALDVFESLLTGTEAQEHPAASLVELVDLLGEHLRQYEQRDGVPEASGVEVLRFLMTQHGLKQDDLPEVGSQGVVSEVLSGKRGLNIRQARALAERFGVDFAVFLKE